MTATGDIDPRSNTLAVRFVEWWRAIPPGTKDATFAVLWTLATQVELLLVDGIEGSLLAQSLSFTVMTMSLAWRRTHPLLAAFLLGVGTTAQTLVGVAEIVGGFVAMLVVTYSVASYSVTTLSALAGAVFIFAGLFTYPVVNDVSLADEFGNLAIFAIIWVLGRLVRTWRGAAAEAEVRAEETERAREEHVRAALADERGRIARELHDVVAHGVSGMVLQAGAARQMLDHDPAAAKRPLLAVEQLGREALDEMRRLLGLLRGGEEDLALGPPVRLAALDELCDTARGAGLQVRTHIEGEPRPLPPGLELSAYRIVQEALTNTVKHADASNVDIVLRYDDAGLELQVTDDGRGPTGDGGPGTGHGLIGMRERAQLFDGSVTAGGTRPSGWVVHARLNADATS